MSFRFAKWIIVFAVSAGCQFNKRVIDLGSAENSIGPEERDQEGLECKNDNPDGISCKIVNGFTNFIVDSFERDDVIVPGNGFGWRKIIDDYGTIVSGQGGNHVDAQIYDDIFMGPAFTGNRALYSFGRQGYSVHNIYLITETFNMNDLVGEGDSVVIEFNYMGISLEEDEYLRLEVCNDTAEACGVGTTLTVEGLNSDKWKTHFEVSGETQGMNGRNHQASDYSTAKVVLFLEDFQKNEFIFRFNSRMDEGFKNNNANESLVDGVIIDNVRATAYDVNNQFEDDIESPDDLLDFDPDEL